VRQQLWDTVQVCGTPEKSKISTVADRCLLSVPTVITGGDRSMEISAPTQRIIVPLFFEGQLISVALIIHT
jgi:hypothetical protein